ncbi:MAG: Crp/Fnr family transcriptional regulator [Acidobacteriota bacterium]
MEHIAPDALARLPLFRRVSPEDRGRVASVSSVRHFQRGDTIFAEGDAPDIFVTVLTGHVKVFKQTPAGKDVILDLFGPGDPIGAVAVYEGRAYPASAAAMEDTSCLLIERRAFFQLLEQHPSMVRGLLTGLTIRIFELSSRLADLTGGHVDARFARMFLKLADTIGTPDRGGIFIPMVLSRQELADLTGTTIETCIRIMSRWGKDEILRTERDGFVVVDRATLEQVGA